MLLLAPMDGLTDPLMRELLTSVGGYDSTATEFVRVTQGLLPIHVFRRYSPELASGGKTSSGIPVFVQLLGGDPQLMAENAAMAVELGAPGIDINFGCPAKKVNNHDGGSVILKEPRRVHDITRAVRKAVPATIPVTVKIRLGYASKELALENSLAAESAGARWLTVHARTKIQGYKPPADWRALADLRIALKIPLIGNGEIWSLEDFKRCREISGCDHFMLGRGAVANPFLAREIVQDTERLGWPQLEPLWQRFFDSSHSENYLVARSKQWLRLLSRSHNQGNRLFEDIKRLQDLSSIRSQVESSFDL